MDVFAGVQRLGRSDSEAASRQVGTRGSGTNLVLMSNVHRRAFSLPLNCIIKPVLGFSNTGHLRIRRAMGSRNTESRVKNLKKEIQDLKKEIEGYRDERLVAVNKITSCFAELEGEYHEYPDPISQIVDFCRYLYLERQRWNLEVQGCNEEMGEEIRRQKQELAEKDRELSDVKKALLEKDQRLNHIERFLLDKGEEAKKGKRRLLRSDQGTYKQKNPFGEKPQQQQKHVPNRSTTMSMLGRPLTVSFGTASMIPDSQQTMGST